MSGAFSAERSSAATPRASISSQGYPEREARQQVAHAVVAGLRIENFEGAYAGKLDIWPKDPFGSGRLVFKHLKGSIEDIEHSGHVSK